MGSAMDCQSCKQTKDSHQSQICTMTHGIEMKWNQTKTIEQFSLQRDDLMICHSWPSHHDALLECQFWEGCSPVLPSAPPHLPITSGRKIAVKSIPHIRLLQTQLEEQGNLEVTLSFCFDWFLEESSIYEAALFTNSETRKFSEAGLVQKVKS